LPGKGFGFGRADGLTVQRMRLEVVVDVALVLELVPDEVAAVVGLDDVDEEVLLKAVGGPLVLILLVLEVFEDEPPFGN
jgi:hypothetical protein